MEKNVPESFVKRILHYQCLVKEKYIEVGKF
jgi:hypothetical protein